MNEYTASEEKVPLGIMAAFVGLPFTVLWLLWANYYVHYLESYTLTKTLFFVFLPYMLPLLNSSLFLTFYIAVQLILYDASKEFMVLVWYSSLVVALVPFGIVDILQIGMRNTGGKPILSVALGTVGVALAVLMFFSPQIALYTFIARLPLYIVSAILIKGG